MSVSEVSLRKGLGIQTPPHTCSEPVELADLTREVLSEEDGSKRCETPGGKVLKAIGKLFVNYGCEDRPTTDIVIDIANILFPEVISSEDTQNDDPPPGS